MDANLVVRSAKRILSRVISAAVLILGVSQHSVADVVEVNFSGHYPTNLGPGSNSWNGFYDPLGVWVAPGDRFTGSFTYNTAKILSGDWLNGFHGSFKMASDPLFTYDLRGSDAYLGSIYTIEHDLNVSRNLYVDFGDFRGGQFVFHNGQKFWGPMFNSTLIYSGEITPVSPNVLFGREVGGVGQLETTMAFGGVWYGTMEWYLDSASFRNVSAVPEIGAYALMLAGLSLLHLAARGQRLRRSTGNHT